MRSQGSLGTWRTQSVPTTVGTSNTLQPQVVVYYVQTYYQISLYRTGHVLSDSRQIHYHPPAGPKLSYNLTCIIYNDFSLPSSNIIINGQGCAGELSNTPGEIKGNSTTDARAFDRAGVPASGQRWQQCHLKWNVDTSHVGSLQQTVLEMGYISLRYSFCWHYKDQPKPQPNIQS